MNLGQIIQGVRLRSGQRSASRWTQADLTQLTNDAAIQISLDTWFPQATFQWETLQPPAQPSVALVGAPGTTTINYWIVLLGSLPIGGESAPSPSVQIANAPAARTGSDYVVVSWPSVAGASYYVLRQVVGTDPWPQLLAQVTASADSANIHDDGTHTPSLYQIKRGNETQLPNLISILRVYFFDQAGDQQPLVPSDIDTLAGVLDDTWDQSSGTVQGLPQYTPQYIAQGPVAYPVQSQVGGRVPVTAPWSNVPGANGGLFPSSGNGSGQRPTYYLRGGYLGILPPQLVGGKIYMDYIAQPPPMQQSFDTSIHPDAFREAYYHYILDAMYQGDEKTTIDGKSHKQLYDEEVARLRSQYVRNLQADKPQGPMPLTRRRTNFGGWPV